MSGPARLLLAALIAIPFPTAAQEFDGWYAGVSLGANEAELLETERQITTGAPNATYLYTGDGTVVGAFVGRNWQRNRAIYGVELGLRTGESVDLTFGPNDTFSYDARVLFDVTLRYGYAVRDTTQIYALAGMTLATFHYDWVSGGAPDTGFVSSKGYRLGIGVEHLIGDHTALRLGLDVTNRDTDTFTSPILPAFSYEGELQSVSLSVGVAYFFDR